MKKLIAALITCTLTAAMLVGCGSSDEGSSPSNAGAGSDVNAEITDAGTQIEADTNADLEENKGNDNGQDASGTSGGEFTTVTDGVLTMATNAYFPPYEYYEGSDIVGIDAEIADAIAKKLGLELKIEDMEFESIIIAVSQGKADLGLAGMTVTEDRLKSVDFTDSYATGIQVVIVTEDSPIKTLEDLEGKKVGVQFGTTGDSLVKEKLGEDSADQYNKGSDAIMALKQGKVDAVVIDNQPALSYVGTTDGLKILDTEFAVEDYAAAIAKGNEGLVEAINNALAELKSDGTIQSILDKYIKADE